MGEDTELTAEEQEVRDLNLLRSQITSSSSGDSIAELERIPRVLADGHGDSWQTALSVLEDIAEERPEALARILAELISEHTTVPQRLDERELRAEHSLQEWYSTISNDPDIGIPVRITWVLDTLAEAQPRLLLDSHEALLKRYRDSPPGTLPLQLFLVLGKLAIVSPDGMPTDQIRSDLQELASGTDFYATEATDLLEELPDSAHR